MTLQQLKYIVAVDRYRSFAQAAEACGVTQPTLSGMIAKLEQELDVRIFARTSKHVEPTAIGAEIVLQAGRTISEAERIQALVEEARGSVSGDFSMAVSPGIAQYILPDFIRYYISDYPQVRLSVEEMKTQSMIDALRRGTVDAGISVCGNACPGLLEIPLYTEKFCVYLSGECARDEASFSPGMLEHENMWVMKEVQCLRDSAFSFCKARAKGRRVYEAGNIETLIRIVDTNGGYTIIPEMHVPLLSERQRANVRDIEGDYKSYRRISLYVREDYVREHMLNTISDTLKRFIPARILDSRIVKFGIRL